MSGRSAHVRVKKDMMAQETFDRSSYTHRRSGSLTNQVAVISRHNHFESENSSNNGHSAHEGQGNHGLGGQPECGQSSFPSQQQYHAREPHVYRPMPPKQLRPIIIASAIERSDFRVHVDGLADGVRSKLGKFIGMGDAKQKKSDQNRVYSSPFDSPAPAVTAVPSLVHSANTDPSGRNMYRSDPQTDTSSPRRGDPTSSRHGSQISIPRPEIRVFSGLSVGRSSWRTLPNSPEALSSTVDTLVLMFAPTQASRPLASFYINSQVLRDSGSTKFVELLEDRPVPRSNRFSTMGYPKDEDGITYETLSTIETGESRIGIRDSSETPSTSTPLSDYNVDMMQYLRDHPDQARPTRSNGIRYELYIDCPEAADGEDSTTYLLAVRNFFAVLHDYDALCGVNLFDVLSNLTLHLFQSEGYLGESADKKAFIIDFLKRHKYEDVRNNPAYAASILAFSELPQIKWYDGFVESFIHCTGMRLLGLLKTQEWNCISPYTQILIYNASSDMIRRFRKVQKYFAAFDFGSMWPATIPAKACGRAAFERFRQWICIYMSDRDQTLEHSLVVEDFWLNPTRLQLFMDVLHSLFDYLVDRDIIFDGTEYGDGSEWKIISKSGAFFQADPNSELPMTSILCGFDKAQSLPHMPHPYPLLPPSMPGALKTGGRLNKRQLPVLDDHQLEEKGSSYTEASNLYQLGRSAKMDRIIADFNAFEHQDDIREIDPRDARLGRWVLIYGALQMLATIETATPSARFTKGTRYNMSIPMKGVVPWAEPGAPPVPDPKHSMSHTFVAPRSWPTVPPRARAGSHKPIVWGEFGDGRVRAGSALEAYRAMEQSRPYDDLLENGSHPSDQSNPSIRSPTSDKSDAVRPSTSHTDLSALAYNDDVPKKVPEKTFAIKVTQSQLIRVDPVADKGGVNFKNPGGRGGLSDVSETGDSLARAQAEAEKTRLRRAQVHGFSNYRPPSGW